MISHKPRPPYTPEKDPTPGNPPNGRLVGPQSRYERSGEEISASAGNPIPDPLARNLGTTLTTLPGETFTRRTNVYRNEKKIQM